MRILYFDPIVGVSGDMMLAALIDLGVRKDLLQKSLSFVPGSAVKVGRANRQGVSARTVKFKITRPTREKQFIPLIKKSRLSPKIKAQAINIIEKMFVVERKVHRAKHLHLHELANADTLLDIVGVLVAIDQLAVDRIFTKPVKAGRGFVKTVEGNMPAFNFATAELLKGFPVHFLPIAAELTTPTGAAILSSIATPAENIILSRMDSVGLGAGSMNLDGYPNVLRVFLGESHAYLTDECTIIETNIDDMNPQDYESLFETLYAAGALEVFLTSTIMKRSRPGILLTILCKDQPGKMIDVLFEHTTSIGFRVSNTQRFKFNRRIVKFRSPYGSVSVKLIEHDGKQKFSLEYRDLKRIAQKQERSVNDVRNELMRLVQRKLAKYNA